ncbi:MAG: cysteine--tRNA ligase [Phenylobacterium sp.]|uniref:cysteine--tRNA ligase n=1 Tax=Phenylobacterium sp. TaxID=1871053 RepID=UPI00271A832E|nr:cysteine--tRNA ligase [Phenylobacterium sp.]MDO8321419.1 cysteine--tRNA ligase [Phenylobacterium sp.]MDO8911505.1 cysteine--tRNA ligase [Phenylobacterium sp.]MDP3100254.1 cysteine--tRNA ligase [Phenylobacterium sp.]
MTLNLYDTMARAKRPFAPRDPKRVTMYVCGPTVYNYAHIGNARPVVAFDVLFRLLRHTYGADAVIYAANVTDVDDKINKKAAEEGVDISVITDRYLDIYNADMSVLGALRPTHQPRATQTMDAIIAMIGRLVRNNAAYVAEGHVLFDTQAYSDYGKLSGHPMEDMIAGARVDVAPYKQHPADFVLWKPSKDNEPVWESPWGPGRPGWHIECSAMIEQALGLPIDIHGGGIDLLFPHHENEMAQGLCAGHEHGQGAEAEYARYWMHNGFLNMGAEKMSKSVGNVALVHQLIQQAPGEALRWALLVGQYRAPLDWTEELIEQSKKALDRLYGALRRSSEVKAEATGPSVAFLEALEDDLNTPAAMAELFAMATALETARGDDRAYAKGELLASANLMGFLFADPEYWFQAGVSDELRDKVDGLIADRVAARTAKDWAAADRIRGELTALNIEVMDNPTGATWRIKEQS